MDYGCHNRTCFMDNIKKKKTIHELAKANPNKTYNELEKERAKQSTNENNSGLVIDDTDECENCQ